MSDARRMQIGGDHYVTKAVQPWDAMRAWMSDEAFCGYLQGNVIKYLSRYRDKGGVEDLKKAAHYLQRLIEEEDVAHDAQNQARHPSADEYQAAGDRP